MVAGVNNKSNKGAAHRHFILGGLRFCVDVYVVVPIETDMGEYINCCLRCYQNVGATLLIESWWLVVVLPKCRCYAPDW